MNTAHARPDHAAELRRELTDVRAVIDALGLKAKREGVGFKVLCPWHEEKTPSCSVRLGQDQTIQVKCHGTCGTGGDVLSLIAQVRGLNPRTDFQAVLAEAAELAGRRDILAELEGRGGERMPSAPRQAPRPAPPPEPERTYPPQAEVEALWAASGPTNGDAEVSTWLCSRALDPQAIDARGLARALPAKGLPTWVEHRNHTGHRCVLPVFDAEGQMRSVRTRQVRGEGAKALPAKGYSPTGLVLADRTARAMLEHGKLPGGRLVIAEGEPDFLTFAARISDTDELPPGVLGIPGSGAMTADILERVPSGSTVAIWTHRDRSGDAYALTIIAALEGRCQLRRGR